jgi:putative addiction module killer protein
MPIIVVEYVRQDGSSPYRTWFEGLPAQAAAKVATAVLRLELGNVSRVKWLGAISEYRIDWGPGYRVYLGREGEALIILLGGGTKQRQRADIGRGERDVDGIQGAQGCAAERQEVMALTRDFKETIVERLRREPEFAKALLDEAATLFLNREPHTARLILRDLVNATVGFERLAAETAKPAKSLHRMLSKKGNPTVDNLAAILRVLRKKPRVDIQARSVKAA